jgi:hypothetical protein
MKTIFILLIKTINFIEHSFINDEIEYEVGPRRMFIVLSLLHQ